MYIACFNPSSLLFLSTKLICIAVEETSLSFIRWLAYSFLYLSHSYSIVYIHVSMYVCVCAAICVSPCTVLTTARTFILDDGLP